MKIIIYNKRAFKISETLFKRLVKAYEKYISLENNSETNIEEVIVKTQEEYFQLLNELKKFNNYKIDKTFTK